MRIRPFAGRARRRAAATVEFAFVVPLLLMFMLGIVEYGRLLMAAQIGTNASREGARYAVQADTTPTDVDTYTRTYLTQAGIPAAAIASVSTDYRNSANQWVTASSLSSLAQGTAVRVTVKLNFDSVSWLPTTVFVSKGSQLTESTVMRKE